MIDLTEKFGKVAANDSRPVEIHNGRKFQTVPYISETDSCAKCSLGRECTGDMGLYPCTSWERRDLGLSEETVYFIEVQ